MSNRFPQTCRIRDFTYHPPEAQREMFRYERTMSEVMIPIASMLVVSSFPDRGKESAYATLSACFSRKSGTEPYLKVVGEFLTDTGRHDMVPVELPWQQSDLSLKEAMKLTEYDDPVTKMLASLSIGEAAAFRSLCEGIVSSFSFSVTPGLECTKGDMQRYSDFQCLQDMAENAAYWISSIKEAERARRTFQDRIEEIGSVFSLEETMAMNFEEI